ncbi:MAG: hypothetical protein K0B37_08300 [Bacteroidales bacterium]|nr:hypothetical protein [Bacteroidales bacterium]
MNKSKYFLAGLVFVVVTFVSGSVILELMDTGLESFYSLLQFTFKRFTAALVMGCFAGVINIYLKVLPFRNIRYRR